tara:strand:- start:534 stop:782 length:249 start_codon:yes stop_codon:yes gene_type:complete
MKLNNLRQKIDNIDLEIIRLLDQRMEVCKEVGVFKKENNLQITHANRELEIISNLSKCSSFTKDEVTSLYEIIFKISKSKQI